MTLAEVLLWLSILANLVSIWALHRARLELRRERDELRRQRRYLMGLRDKTGA